MKNKNMLTHWRIHSAASLAEDYILSNIKGSKNTSYFFGQQKNQTLCFVYFFLPSLRSGVINSATKEDTITYLPLGSHKTYTNKMVWLSVTRKNGQCSNFQPILTKTLPCMTCSMF